MAGAANHPVYVIGDLASADARELLVDLRPDVIVVACFPRRIPSALYSVASLGAINIHPSLLPEGRGPDPLFWTLRRGDGQAGVTIHELVDEFDAGPVLAQASHTYADGATETTLERDLAVIGGDLTAGVIQAMSEGRASRVEQRAERATYQSWPTTADYTIDLNRSARSAFNFVCGIQERGQPILLRLPRTTVRIDNVVGWSDTAQRPPSDDIAVITFAEGVLLARITPMVQHPTLLP
jgi:methionyl-tRNA formyltransferase